MKLEEVEVYGFRAALRGMRNAGESWAKADSVFGFNDGSPQWKVAVENPRIGPEDMKLACKLIKSGYIDQSMAEANNSEHKFLRDIEIWMDLTIPLMAWAELDTYKVDTVRNSCSTMYKLGTRDLTPDDFQDRHIRDHTLVELNELGTRYRSTTGADHVDVLHTLKLELPSGYLQRATYHFNYETALKIYFERRHHRLPEWNDPNLGICVNISRLPYMPEFIQAASR